MNITSKLFISNIILFLLFLTSFYFLYYSFQELNFELQYREMNKPICIEFENLINCSNSDDDLNKNYFNILIFLLGISLILILNQLYYLNKMFFEEKKLNDLKNKFISK